MGPTSSVGTSPTFWARAVHQAVGDPQEARRAKLPEWLGHAKGPQVSPAILMIRQQPT